MQLIIIVVSILLLGAAPAEIHQSKTEEPTKAKTTETQDAESTPAATILPSPVTKLPTQSTQAEAATKQKSTQEEWLGPSTLPNWVIALVTLAYVGVSIGQLVAIRRQAKFARRTLRAIRRQEIIANDDLLETRKTADAAASNADTLIRQNSPYLRFSSFKLADEKPPVVRYVLRNYGGGRAFLKEYATKLLLTAETLPETPLDEGILQFSFDGITLGTMDATPSINVKLPQDIQTFADVRNIPERKQRLFVYGFVRCVDVLRQIHTFGFGYEFVNDEFVEAGGSAYNYRRCEQAPSED